MPPSTRTSKWTGANASIHPADEHTDAECLDVLHRVHIMTESQAASQRTSREASRAASRAASIHESLYSNRVSFLRRAAHKVGFRQKVSVKPEELRRFSSIQAAQTGSVLARHPSRPHA